MTDLSPRTLSALDAAGVSPDAAAKMSPEELAAIPGIGPVGVQEILAAREEIETDHHMPEEAVEDDTEHHPVADPPRPDAPPMVHQGTRSDDQYGAATHIERINPDIVPVRPADVMTPTKHRVVSYAPDDHPEGVRWPYTLTRPAFTKDHAKRPAGFMVWLLPHEVSSFHRLVDRARFKDLGVEQK